MRALLILPTLLLVALPASAQQNDLEQYASFPAASTTSAAEDAALRQLQAHLSFLASDAMGGRDTATVQAEITAQYVAAQLRMYGFEPAGDNGTFIQTYPLMLTSLDVDALRFDLMQGEDLVKAFAPDDDYAVRGYGGAGYEVQADVVFAGHGLYDETTGVNDFAGLDVSGKLVMVFGGAPTLEETEPTLIVASNWRAKQARAKTLGAVGMILINAPDDPRADQWFRFAKARMRGESMTLGGAEQMAQPFPRLYLEPAAAAQIFSAAGKDFDAAYEARAVTAGQGGFPLDGVSLSLAAPVTATELSSSNTVGLLRGSNPDLADEMIVLSAHMDHVGIDDAGNIYNGADDNATGTTTVLMVAQALARDPRLLGRSVLVLGVTGEEKGLLGSEWWVDNPTVDIGKVVANINIDMVGRNESGTIGATPSPTHPEYNSLVSLAESLAPEAGIKLEWEQGLGDLRRRVDDYYYRSDHVNFSNAGIPVIFFFAGEHEDYHKPTDTVDKIDIRKVLKVANLVTLLTRAASMHPEQPVRFGQAPASNGR